MNALVIALAILWLLCPGVVLVHLVDGDGRLADALELLLPAGGEDR